MRSMSSTGLKLKLDQGFKPLLRGFRKGLKQAFKISGLAVGKHHWRTEEKWMRKSKIFAEKTLGFIATDKEAAILSLLLYPTLGPTKSKQLDSRSQIY